MSTSQLVTRQSNFRTKVDRIGSKWVNNEVSEPCLSYVSDLTLSFSFFLSLTHSLIQAVHSLIVQTPTWNILLHSPRLSPYRPISELQFSLSCWMSILNFPLSPTWHRSRIHHMQFFPYCQPLHAQFTYTSHLRLCVRLSACSYKYVIYIC